MRRAASGGEVGRADGRPEAGVRDIDDMLDAIVAFRKTRGRGDIGDALARELLRGARDE